MIAAAARALATAVLLAAIASCGGSNPPAGDDDDDDTTGDDDDDDDLGPDAGPDAGPDLDAAPADAVVPTVSPEIDGQITINEVMASNALTILDDAAAPSDWVELYNPTGEDIPLHGYALTDDLGVPLKGPIGVGVVLPAGGHLVLWLDNDPSIGPTHLDFKLAAAEGGELGLARPDGSYIDRLRYGAQATDFSAAREPDGSDLWVIEWHVSPGAANPDGAGQSMGLEVDDAEPESVPEAGDLSERILGYDVIPELQILVTDAAGASLQANPDTDVEATLVFDGRAYGPVGLRLKGQNSFESFYDKPSLRVNVDEWVERAEFFGLKDLTLNNMHSDYSMMHERLAYWVARQVGLPASRANHLFLRVNDEVYGLYTNVETVKKRMIGRWFDDDMGPLFEATDVDFATPYIASYELEAGPDDRSKLEGLAAALALPSADAAIAAAAQHANLDELRRYWAMAAVIGQFDAFPYSNPGDDYYVYADPTSDRLQVMPWGMDESFYAGSYDVLQTSSIFAQRCKESPACLQAIVDEIWEVQAMTEALDLEAERVHIIDQIAPYVAMDTNKSYSDAEVATFQTNLYWFITDRREHLETMLPPATP